MKILSFPEYAKQGKYDPISVGIVIAIFAFMIFAAVFILSWAGVLALVVGGGIVAYQMLAPRPKNLFYSYGHKNRLSLLSIILTRSLCLLLSVLIPNTLSFFNNKKDNNPIITNKIINKSSIRI